MEKSLIKAVLSDQKTLMDCNEGLIERDIDLSKVIHGKEIVVISGIRRCGKSTLLKIAGSSMGEAQVFVDFSDIRFTDFTERDYPVLDEAIHESIGVVKTYLLDEIQNVPSWQRWVRTLFTNGKKVILTGSNSGLLRSDISTLLTGRNRVIRLFPFSFGEFLKIKGIPFQNANTSTTPQRAMLHNAFEEYRTSGGFPEVIKQNDVGLARYYFEDIITKDIIARYGIRDPKAVREMALFLVSNTGRSVSYPSMTRMVGIKSLSTVKKYLDHLEESYLFRRINKFSYSLKKQTAAPAKYYASDVGFITSISFRSSQNRGQRLENVVFNHLDRTRMEIYYHQGERECDFILKDGPTVVQAIQVADEIPDRPTKDREIAGLMEAMEEYELEEGLIITSDVTEEFEIEGRRIQIIPAWRWTLETPFLESLHANRLNKEKNLTI